MNRAAMIRRVRSYTRDLSASIFRTIDVTDFLQEGVDRIKARIPQLKTMNDLSDDEVVLTLLPTEYHYLLPVYASARCFAQDERHYQASTLMNEFEVKLEEMLSNINDGNIIIIGVDGKPINMVLQSDYVRQVYYDDRPSDTDIDKGVSGVI